MKLDLITNKAEKQGEVNPNDEFYTPNYAIEPLLKYLPKGSRIWCPFDTQELIETVSDAPRLEMFARRKRVGWDIWGNELDNDVELGTSANNGR